jgi:hypothetical protein
MCRFTGWLRIDDRSKLLIGPGQPVQPLCFTSIQIMCDSARRLRPSAQPLRLVETAKVTSG